MGSYRGKVNDDVIGYKPSKPNSSGYGIKNYNITSKNSSKKRINKLKLVLDKIIDEDPFLDNLLFFNKEKYISIEYNWEFLTNPNFEIRLDLAKYPNGFNELWDSIKIKNENHYFDYEFQNIYLSFGFVKYEDYLIPLCFIPLKFKENSSELIFFPNNNLNIQLNYYLIDELYDFEFPLFDGNLTEYINKISQMDKLQFIEKAFIGNFNLNIVNFCYDLDNPRWVSFSDKFRLFSNNKHVSEMSDVVNLNNKLADNWIDLDLKINSLNLNNVSVLIKNLLGNEKRMIFVSNIFQRDLIKKELHLSNLDNLILDYSMLYEKNIYELISDEYIIDEENFEEFSQLNDKLIELETCCQIINNTYSQLGLTPREIKRFKDKFHAKIKGVPHDFPIINAKTYKFSYINKLKKQLILAIENSIPEYIELYLPDDFFNSTDYKIYKTISDSFENNLNTFISINNQINEIYGIKKFKNLSEVQFLDYLDVLSKSCKFIEEEDKLKINNLLKMVLNKEFNNIDNEFDDVLDKYNIKEDFIENIEYHIKYSELIEHNLFYDENLIKDNLSVIIEDVRILYQIYEYILKQLDYIFDFYNVFKCFKTPKELFDSKKSISCIVNLISIFKHDFKMLEEYNHSFLIDFKDVNIKNYFNHWKSGKIKKEFVSDVFSYNLYNSILNSFLEEFEYINEEYIDSSYYDNKYEEIYSQIKEKEKNQFKQSIYLKLNKLNLEDNVKKQKDDWSLKIDNNDLISNHEAFTNYKDYIFTNKPIFMINFESIPIILNETFENYFDYILVCSNENIGSIFDLSLFLRTKNKLIIVGQGEY